MLADETSGSHSLCCVDADAKSVVFLFIAWHDGFEVL